MRALTGGITFAFSWKCGIQCNFTNKALPGNPRVGKTLMPKQVASALRDSSKESASSQLVSAKVITGLPFALNRRHSAPYGVFSAREMGFPIGLL